jgi:hypothetical protein
MKGCLVFALVALFVIGMGAGIPPWLATGVIGMGLGALIAAGFGRRQLARELRRQAEARAASDYEKHVAPGPRWWR